MSEYLGWGILFAGDLTIPDEPGAYPECIGWWRQLVWMRFDRLWYNCSVYSFESFRTHYLQGGSNLVCRKGIWNGLQYQWQEKRLIHGWILIMIILFQALQLILCGSLILTHWMKPDIRCKVSNASWCLILLKFCWITRSHPVSLSNLFQPGPGRR